MSYVIGIDLGTGSLKGIVVNQAGDVMAQASSPYDLQTPQSGYSEQNPQDWLRAFDEVIISLLTKYPEAKAKTEGISFSGQMHSLVLLDQEDQVIRPAILWNDVRTTKQCEWLMEHHRELLLKVTKNRALEGFTLPKLLWVRENEPENWSKAAHFLLPKDYLGFYVTGQKQMEYSDAAGTLLLDIENKVWSEDLIEAFSLNQKMFPKLVASTDQIGVMQPSLKEKFGFEQEVKIFAGGADNACAALAAGITSSGIGMVSIGTSGVFLSYEPDGKQEYGGALHYFNHAQSDSYYSMGVTLAAGYSLDWFKKNFAPAQTFEEMLSDIDQIPCGSDGLLFTPYLMGERSPYFDSKIRGSFIGMSAQHTFKHFVRSVLEGITFSLKDSQVLMEKYAGRKFEKIVSVGGGAKNKEWLQIQADIFDTEIVTLQVEEGPAFGAAMIAAVGCGWFKNLMACSTYFVHYGQNVTPQYFNQQKYCQIYSIYQKMYPATKEICYQLT